MDCFAGLDVSTRKTAICVISNDGEILLETETLTEPAAITAALRPFRKRIAKVGHETGSLAPWLHKELQRAGLPIVCLEALHTRAMLAGQRNKTDRNDALGIAQILRAGWYKTAHVKSNEAHRMRLLLAHRRALKRKAVDLENAVRHTLKAFGVRLHAVGRRQMNGAIATKCDTLVADAERAAGQMRQVAGDLRGLRQAIRNGTELTAEQRALKGAFERIFGEGSATAGRLGRVAGNLERGAAWLDSPSTRVRFGGAGAPLNVPNSPGDILQVNWELYSRGSQANRIGWMIHDSGHGIGLLSDTYPMHLNPNDTSFSWENRLRPLYGRWLPRFAAARGSSFVEQVPDAMRCIAAPWSGGPPGGIPCP